MKYRLFFLLLLANSGYSQQPAWCAIEKVIYQNKELVIPQAYYSGEYYRLLLKESKKKDCFSLSYLIPLSDQCPLDRNKAYFDNKTMLLTIPNVMVGKITKSFSLKLKESLFCIDKI